MRFLLLVFCIIPALLPAQQRYISSAIIAYSGGAYDRSIRDLNRVLENPEQVTEEEAGKAYFYRAMARLKLAGSKPEHEELGADPFLLSHADFRAAISLNGEQWSERSKAVADELYEGLWNTGLSAFDQANYISCINHLRAASTLKNNFEVNAYLGKAYEALGEDFFISQNTRSVANFRAAVNYLEDAIDIDPECLECARSLVNVATKLNDEERVRKYQHLVAKLNSQ